MGVNLTLIKLHSDTIAYIVINRSCYTVIL